MLELYFFVIKMFKWFSSGSRIGKFISTVQNTEIVGARKKKILKELKKVDNIRAKL